MPIRQATGDARFVAFTSLASNLVPDDTNGVADIFVRDLVDQTTNRVSLSDEGDQSAGASSTPSIGGT